MTSPILFHAVPKRLVLAAKAYYRQPHRHYHTWDHVRKMMLVARELRWELSLAEQLAVLFHDAVYVPQAGKGVNEQLSADMLRVCAQRIDDPAAVEQAAAIILATASHQPDARAARVCDLDLAVLGGTLREYRRYTSAVGEEHRSYITAADYCAGRIRFLQSMLAGPSIYQTPEAALRFEDTARGNMSLELNYLQGCMKEHHG